MYDSIHESSQNHQSLVPPSFLFVVAARMARKVRGDILIICQCQGNEPGAKFKSGKPKRLEAERLKCPIPQSANRIFVNLVSYVRL